MPKETFISRFAMILKRLEKGPPTCRQIKELLSYGSDLVVIGPLRLRNKIKNALSSSLKHYT
jgi:hypothetical protein